MGASPGLAPDFFNGRPRCCEQQAAQALLFVGQGGGGTGQGVGKGAVGGGKWERGSGREAVKDSIFS